MNFYLIKLVQCQYQCNLNLEKLSNSIDNNYENNFYIEAQHEI